MALAPLFRIREPLRHLLVVVRVVGPALRRAAPTMVLDRHVDTTVDEERS
jgi:hypothetical protein